MAARASPLARARRHPILTAGVLCVVVAALAMLAARLWVASDSGQRFIEAQINGRDIAGLGVVALTGLDGDPLSDAGLARLTLADGEGVWLAVEDIKIKWSPGGLLLRTIDIETIEIATVRVLRRPDLAPRTSGGDTQWSFTLGNLELDQLILEDGVAGVASTFSVYGGMRRDAAEGVVLAFKVEPKGSGGDQVELQARWGGGRELELHLDAKSPAGGALGALAGIDPESAIELRATASGSFANAIGEAKLRIGGHDTIIAAGKIEAGEAIATAHIDADRLPLNEDWRRAIGTGADAALSATIKGERAAFAFTGQIASGEVGFEGAYDISDRRLAGPLAVRADLSSLKPVIEAPLGIVIDGVILDPHHNPSFEGDIRAVAAESSELPFEAIAGTVAVASSENEVSFSVDLVGLDVLANNARARKALGDAPRLVARGAFTQATDSLTLSEATLSGAAGQVTGKGTANTNSRSFNIAGTLDLDIGHLVDSGAGRANGIYGAEGQIDSMVITSAVGLTSLHATPDILDSLIGGKGRLDMALVVERQTVTAQTLRFKSDGLEIAGSGAVAGEGAPSIIFDGAQKLPIDLSGAAVNLAQFRGSIGEQDTGWSISATSENGSLSWNNRVVQKLAAQVDIASEKGAIRGPFVLSGESAETPIALSGEVSQTMGEVQLNGLVGQFGSLAFTGRASQSDEAGMAVDLSGATKDFAVPGGIAGAADFTLRAALLPRAQPVITAALTARAIVLDGFGRIDALSAELNTAGEGYTYSAALKSTDAGRPLDLVIAGRAHHDAENLAGTFDISGSALGGSVSTRAPITWSTGRSPTFAIDITIFGGQFKAALSNDGPSPTFLVSLDAIEGQSIFRALGLPDLSAKMSGQGSFQPFGLTPKGNFKLQTSSDVSGLETPVVINGSGKLDSRALRLSATAVYGGRLSVSAESALPVRVAADRFVSLDRSGKLEGSAVITGDLGALGSAAQAYGQDIGGMIDGRATLSGSFSVPKANATAQISNGSYELGLTGLRLVGLDIKAGLADGAVSVDLTGAGANGGTVDAAGVVRPGSGDIRASLNRLLIYDRSGNSVRVTGPLVVTETATARLIKGLLTIDDARISLDSLPSSRTRALAVRWREGDDRDETRRVLQKPLTIDVSADAPRRVMVTGRGLTSEWGVDVRATGIPTAPSLEGTATLVRGELDLAGRPFLFDRGIVRFDGPIENARVDLSAQRSVNGFTARMDITGPPATPQFAFTSTPELPQDEILSRLLFGRSSIDLSAIEATQLAASIARLSGRGSVFDPLGQLQAAIGLDRLSVGFGETGQTEVGAGRYVADSVYLELKSAGVSGNAVLLEWEPAPQIAVTSETRINGDTRLSIRWKKDYD